jgi:hypothetical protein
MPGASLKNGGSAFSPKDVKKAAAKRSLKNGLAKTRES